MKLLNAGAEYLPVTVPDVRPVVNININILETNLIYIIFISIMAASLYIPIYEEAPGLIGFQLQTFIHIFHFKEVQYLQLNNI
jgi:hypothetical protein